MPPPPVHRPNSSPEWNVVHKRQAHPTPGASLQHRSTPKGQPSVPPTGQGAWAPLSPETGRLDRWHPRLCFKGQGGTESSWEPPGGFWTVYLSAEREGTRGSMRWKGMLAKKSCVLLVSSVLPALRSESRFWFLCPLPHWGSVSCPLPLSLSVLPLVYPFPFGRGCPCWSLFLGFRSCYFLLLSLFSVPSVVPPSFRVTFLVLVSAVVWLTFLLSSSPPASKLRSSQLSFLPGKPAVRFFTAASSCSLPGWAPVISGRLCCCWLALGLAPPPRYVLDRRRPVQTGPLPSCHLRLSASSQVPG